MGTPAAYFGGTRSGSECTWSAPFSIDASNWSVFRWVSVVLVAGSWVPVVHFGVHASYSRRSPLRVLGFPQQTFQKIFHKIQNQTKNNKYKLKFLERIRCGLHPITDVVATASQGCMRQSFSRSFGCQGRELGIRRSQGFGEGFRSKS